MLNTPFYTTDPEQKKAMTDLWTAVFAISMQQNLPLVQTMLYLNENFENYYNKFSQDETLKRLVDELGVEYKYNTKE